MVLRFQWRLALAVGALIALTITAMTLVGVALTVNLLGRQYRDAGRVLTQLANDNLAYAFSLSDRALDLSGEQMMVSALLVAELVALADEEGVSEDEVSARLARVRERSEALLGYPLVQDIWVTDETGRIVMGADAIDFTFSPDPAANPQAHAFYDLLTEPDDPVLQEPAPRDKDSRLFRYVGVGGVDQPRIIQVGVGPKQLAAIEQDFSVQNVLERLVLFLDIERIAVFDQAGNVVTAAARAPAGGAGPDGAPALAPPNEAVERVKADGELVRFVEAFQREEGLAYDLDPFGRHVGVLTRLTGARPGGPAFLFIQWRTEPFVDLLRDNLLDFAVLSLVLIALGVVVSVSLSKRFAHPIDELSNGVREFSVGNFTHQVELRTGDEFENLATAFNSMSLSLQDYMDELARETKRRERLESELSIAAEMQRSLLPERPPQVPGLDIRGWSQPARHVGGDFYDFVPLPEGRLGVAIGDATGKGLPAALLITECWSIFRAMAEDHRSPAELLRRVNQALARQVGRSGRFVTFFFMIIDPAAGTLRYSVAGHNPPILTAGDGGAPRQLGSTRGMPLGVSTRTEFEDVEVLLEPGDTILLYSDGLTEAQVPQDGLYGDERLQRLLVAHGTESAGELIELIRDDVGRFLQGAALSDDMTLVAVRYRAREAPAAVGAEA